MKLKVMTPEELAHAYNTDFKEAFPPAELKPLEVMEKMRRRGAYDPLGYYDETGTAQGYILLWKHPHHILLHSKKLLSRITNILLQVF